MHSSDWLITVQLRAQVIEKCAAAYITMQLLISTFSQVNA